MAQNFSPLDEIAAALGLKLRDFERAIRAVHKPLQPKQWLEKHQALGRASIRQAQLSRAIGRAPPKGYKEPCANMLRWLGMQHLGQTPNYATLHKNKDDIPQTAKEEPDGFHFTTPDGVTVISKVDPQGLPAPQEKQPHQEVPEVEAILVKEASQKRQETAQHSEGEAVLVVSAHEAAQ